MAGGFEGDDPWQRSRDYVEADTKIEAAKKWLLAELDGLPNTEVALITFDVAPRLLVRTRSTETQQMKELVPGVEARGPRTDIAAALRMADEVHQSSRAHFKTILLISDGLSNVGDPIAAADECRQHGIQINTVLIDPTPGGQYLANELSRGGTVWPAASGAEMRRAIRAAARTPVASNLVPIIALMVSVAGLVGTLSTILSTGLDRPGLPALVAGAGLLCLLPLLIYVWAAKQEGTAIYTTPTEFYTPRYVKYETLRPFAGVAMLVCVAISLLLFSVGSRMRQALHLRVTNATDYTLSAVKVELPEIDDAFDFTIKPQQSSEYHTASLKFLTCLHLLAGKQRRQGSVTVLTDASPAQPARTVHQENFLPNSGKYTLVVSQNPGTTGIALRLNRE